MDTARNPQATATAQARDDLELIPDLRPFFAALRPLGDRSKVIDAAASSPVAFQRVLDLFLATAPEDHDPIHRLTDGVNHSLYRLAKAVLSTLPEGRGTFAFDTRPDAVEAAAQDTLDRLDALCEYSEGSATGPADRTLVGNILEDSRQGSALEFGLVETLLRRSIALGGRYALDAANLLGYLSYRRGDLDGAELLFQTVIDRRAADSYERETQAHAMNNLTGVHVGRGDLRLAILWCERSLMLKEQLGLDGLSNHLNLLFLWIDQATAYGVDRARHYIRRVLATEAGKASLESTLQHPTFRRSVETFRRCGLDQEFPEIALPETRERKPVQRTLRQSKRSERGGSAGG